MNILSERSANITETLEAHAQTLTELATLPALLGRLQREVKTYIEHQQHRTAVLKSARPKLSVVEANTERANTTESDKGAFVRSCLSETRTMCNADIQRKTSELGRAISPAYISEIRKAFFEGEQTA